MDPLGVLGSMYKAPMLLKAPGSSSFGDFATGLHVEASTTVVDGRISAP